MNQETGFQELIQSIAEKSINLLKNFENKPEEFIALLGKWLD